MVGDSAAAILAGELGSQRDSRFRLLCQRASTLKEAERRGIGTRLLSEVGQHGDQDVLVLLDGALDVPNLLRLLRPRGRLILARPPGSPLTSHPLPTTVDGAAIRSFARSFWFGCLLSHRYSSPLTDLPNSVLALDEVSQWWQQPRARTLVRIGAAQ